MNMWDELAFRPAEKRDLPMILAQSEALIRQYEDLTAIDIDKVLAWMAKKTEQNLAEYTCVMLGADTVGVYRLAAGDNGTELDDFYILPRFRGQGIGTALLEKLTREVQGPLFLYVFNENRGAIRLYERFGFRKSETVSATRCIYLRKE